MSGEYAAIEINFQLFQKLTIGRHGNSVIDNEISKKVR